ncbi:MAG: efflux RND transporter permease subunit [Pseudomonadales bacterium]|nr:efflux RND transporter permease subunit [Pseudomonadales bacterium]
MTLAENSIRRPIATTMIFLIVIIIGSIGFRFLPVDLLPPIEMPELSVQVRYPDVGPEEMELLITEPLENGLAIVSNLERISSVSSEGQSSISLRFAEGTDLNEASNEVRETLDRIRNSLPVDADPPRINKFNPEDVPIVMVGVRSERELSELTTILERDIRKRFEQIPGIGSIDVWGGVTREVHIEIMRDRLLATGLTMADIIQAVGREGSNRPGGNVQRGLSDVYVRSLGEYKNLDEIRNTVIRSVNGVPLRVGDVADVRFSRADMSRYIEVDDVPMLRLGLRKQSGANTIAVAEEVQRVVENLNRERSDLDFILINDQSTFIQQSIDNVRNSAVWGGILAVIIMLAFFRNGSVTSIISISIPIAIIATFALLYLNGLSLNQMSFGGLALGVGLIVDNAIVVIENIVRLRHHGKSLTESSIVGTKQVTGAVIASTITTSVIFLPVIFMQTLTGTMFQELALVVVFALACSLLVALTLVPMLASRFLTIQPESESAGTLSRHERFLEAVEEQYARLLAWSLHRRLAIVGAVVVLMGIAVFAMRGIPYELTPQTQADEITIRMNMDEGTNIAILHTYMMEMDGIVRELIPWDDVVHYAREVRNSRAEFQLTLVSQENRSVNANELADRIRARIQNAVPGTQVQVRAQSGLWILRRIFGSGGEDSVQVELRGYNLEQAEQLAQRIQDRMETVPGVVDVYQSSLEGRPEQNIRFDRERMASLGISIDDVSSAIQSSITGSRAGVFREAGDEIDIVVRLRPDDRLNVQDIENISVRAADGQVIPISALVTTSYGRGPTDIRRIDGQRVTYIYANLEVGVALGDAMQNIQNALGDMAMPEGFSIVYGGEYEEQQRAQQDFVMAIVMALVLIYMVMAAQFERFLDPLIVMFSVPLALIGVVPTLLLTGTTLNMQSLMGLVMLIGIVVNNAIVLVDYINLLRREENLDVIPAVVKAGRLRLRPILMTTLTTVLGLLPLALGLGAGAELQAALARVVIGGLTASTLITLIFIPILYVAATSAKSSLMASWKRLRHTTPGTLASANKPR